MHKANYLAVVVIGLATVRCRSTNRELFLTIGMPLTEFIPVLQSRGIQASRDEGAYRSPHDLPSQRYVIVTPAGPDALFAILEEDRNGTEYRLVEMYVHKNWKVDRTLPLKKRSDDTVPLDTVR